MRVGDTILTIAAEETSIETGESSEGVVAAIRALTASSYGTARDGTAGPFAFDVAVARVVAPNAAEVGMNMVMIRTEQEAALKFAQEFAVNYRPPLPGTLRELGPIVS